MSLGVMLVVLFAALLHAAWNALIKSASNHLTETVLLSIGAGVVAGFALSFLPLPAAASWPFLAVSVAIHCLYFSLLAFTYRAGDLSFAYPLMRGSAPLFTALLTTAFLGERLGKAGWLGIGLLCAGIVWLSLDNLFSARVQKHALAFGLANAAVIVGYTVVDGLGVRASGNAWSYVLWLFFLNAFPLLVIGLATNAREIVSLPGSAWVKGLISGSCSIASYGLALWAMTHAPIALVAALRETSVLFGTVIAALALKESFGRARWIAAGLITAGAVAIKAF